MLCSATACAIKEGGLEDLEQKIRDPKEELGWTQRTVEGRWQDGNQLDRTILSFPLSHPQVSDVLISDASTQTEGPEGPPTSSLHDNAGSLQTEGPASPLI